MTDLLPSALPTPRRPEPGLWNGVLVEASPDGLVIYGAWRDGFGCWQDRDGEVQEHFPESTIFDRLGRWSDPPGDRDDAWFTARAARSAYFSAFPAHIRVIVGQMPGWQWPLLSLAALSDRFLRQMDDVLKANAALDLVAAIDERIASADLPDDIRAHTESALLAIAPRLRRAA